ncbi:hypothetical protein AB1Y20_021961 [Prymnesium parvum]|uniref:Rab3-GAP regulatory subunit N-terminal domain-containing protein n=1 Tax=Prymnesium parvum TaxID=97485 RepID=A0AB34JI85_PRYPA
MEPLELVDLGLLRHFLGEERHEPWSQYVVALSHDASASAFARGSRLLLLHPRSPDSSAPAVAEVGKDSVCCLEWIERAAASSAVTPPLLLAGCTSGALRAFGARLAPLWSVRPHSAPLVALRLHSHGALPDVLLCYEGGTHVAHAPAAWLRQVVEAEGSSTARAAARKLQRGLVVVPLDASSLAHPVALSCGPLAELPLDVPPATAGASLAPSPKQLALVTAGKSARLYLLQQSAPRQDTPAARRGETPPDGTSAANAHQAHTPASSSSSTLNQLASSSIARGALGSISSWWGGTTSAPAGVPPPSVGADRVAPAPSRALREDELDGETEQACVEEALAAQLDSSATLVREFKDTPRIFTSGSLDPQRRWLALADNVGRVCLLESRSLVVLRVWKGYRDAQCAWSCESKVKPWADSVSTGEESCRLFLVIYAPRRGLLEVWHAPLGGRVHAFSVGAGCLLLSPPPPLQIRARAQGRATAVPRDDQVRKCYILQPTGVTLTLAEHTPCE